MVRKLGNILGAFSDGAILFPLIATLSLSSAYSSSTLFISSGLLYIFSGLFFRIPMPVQPLKAIAIAAVVSGASFQEVRVAGLLVGVTCLIMLALPCEKWADRIPKYYVHGIQLGLGILLVRRAVEIAFPLAPYFLTTETLIVLSSSLFCLVLSRISGLSLLGLFAAIGAAIAILQAKNISPGLAPTQGVFRLETVLGLLLPQILLTSANSVIATRDVAHRYFGNNAEKVSIRRLLCSIGVGNVLMAAIGGLPFCHGSGGMTAHVKGGSTHFFSNLVIGFFLLSLAVMKYFFGGIELSYPPILLSLLLGLVGYYHILLVLPSWKISSYRPTLIAMGIATLVTQNLIFGLIAGAATVLLTLLLAQRKAIA